MIPPMKQRVESEIDFWEEHLEKRKFYEPYFTIIYGENREKLIPLRDLWWIKEQMWALSNLSNLPAEAKYFEGCLNLLREIENKHKELFCEFLENLGFTKTAPDCYDLPREK